MPSCSSGFWVAKHVEGLRQVVALAGDGDVALLHRLQQRRLGAGAGAVDLVGHQKLGEHRAGDEAERAAAVAALLQHLGADDVARHQIGGELDAVRLEAEDGAERHHELGLGEAGDADEQPVAAGEQRHQRPLHHRRLTEDDAADLGARLGDAGDGGFRVAHDGVLVAGLDRHGAHSRASPPALRLGHARRPRGSTHRRMIRYLARPSRATIASGMESGPCPPALPPARKPCNLRSTAPAGAVA